ncbi:phage holin family protein [Stackebrandtia soli]|uniref:phage holin family protein n=1 Tax=Stackebrandtia soli TaxID=1892856 RepID=UPI0039E73F09
MSYLLKIVVTAISLWVTTLIFAPNIDVQADGVGGEIGTLLIVALIFGLVNAIIKPIIKVIGCALYAASLGLFGLIVNAALFLLVDVIGDQFSVPFHIENFWYALLGAIVVAVVGWVLNLVVPDPSDKKKKKK